MPVTRVTVHDKSYGQETALARKPLARQENSMGQEANGQANMYQTIHPCVRSIPPACLLCTSKVPSAQTTEVRGHRRVRTHVCAFSPCRGLSSGRAQIEQHILATLASRQVGHVARLGERIRNIFGGLNAAHFNKRGRILQRLGH